MSFIPGERLPPPEEQAARKGARSTLRSQQKPFRPGTRRPEINPREETRRRTGGLALPLREGRAVGCCGVPRGATSATGTPALRNAKATPRRRHGQGAGHWGAWVARSVKRPTSAQVTISRFVGSRPARVGPCADSSRSLEPASDIVSPPPPLPLPCSCSVSEEKDPVATQPRALP